MPTLSPELTADELITRWRMGSDEDGWDNPAGPRFIGGHSEYEISMTGTFTFHDPMSQGSTCTEGVCTFCC